MNYVTFLSEDEMKRGWWKLSYEYWGEEDKETNVLINDIDREHIGEKIKEGMIEGELIREDEDVENNNTSK